MDGPIERDKCRMMTRIARLVWACASGEADGRKDCAGRQGSARAAWPIKSASDLDLCQQPGGLRQQFEIVFCKLLHSPGEHAYPAISSRKQ